MDKHFIIGDRSEQALSIKSLLIQNIVGCILRGVGYGPDPGDTHFAHVWMAFVTPKDEVFYLNVYNRSVEITPAKDWGPTDFNEHIVGADVRTDGNRFVLSISTYEKFHVVAFGGDKIPSWESVPRVIKHETAKSSLEPDSTSNEERLTPILTDEKAKTIMELLHRAFKSPIFKGQTLDIHCHCGATLRPEWNHCPQCALRIDWRAMLCGLSIEEPNHE